MIGITKSMALAMVAEAGNLVRWHMRYRRRGYRVRVTRGRRPMRRRGRGRSSIRRIGYRM